MKSLITAVLLLCFVGCDRQSPQAKFVSDMPVSLYSTGGEPAVKLDYWITTEPYGANIYGAVFLYTVTVKAGGIGVAGIKVKLNVTGHTDPSGGDGNYWDKLAPNNQPYGYVNCRPIGVWSQNNQEYITRTDSSGVCDFFVGLGNPNTGLGGTADEGYLWPGGNTVIYTYVTLLITIPRYKNTISRAVGATFLSPQYAKFFWPSGASVYDASSSELAMPFFEASSGNEHNTHPLAEQAERPPKPSAFDSNIPSSLTKNLSLIEGEGWELNSVEWGQLVLDEDVWVWVDAGPIIPIWLSDPNDCMDAYMLMSYCEPFSFFADFHVDNNDVWARWHTAILNAHDPNDTIIKRYPITMGGFASEGHNRTYSSNFIVAMDDPNQVGYYKDLWNNDYVAVYVPLDGYLTVTLDDYYGDFDFDSNTTFKDLSFLKRYWHKDANDYYYNVTFDGDMDGKINLHDVKQFCDNWLKPREEFYGDFNNDHIVDFKDFSIAGDDIDLYSFSNNWLKVKM